MIRRASFAIVGIITIASFGAAAPAVAAPKKPGLYGPAKAVVGEEVAFTSAFLAKDRKNICFAPDMEWGDAAPTRGFGICMKFGFSGDYKREVDTFEHTFTQPGTYKVTVTAAGMSATGMPFAKPSLATVKGPASYTRTIVVAPGAEPTPSATPTPTVTEIP